MTSSVITPIVGASISGLIAPVVGNPSSGTTDIANYPFTSDLLDTVTGTSLIYAVEPTPSASGISLVAATNPEIDTTGFPVNDFVLSFTIKINEVPPTFVAAERKFTTNALQNAILFTSGNLPRYAKETGAPNNVVITLSGAGALNGRTLDVSYTQSSADGITFAVDEVGGSAYSDSSSNTTAAAKVDCPAWNNITLGERSDGSLQCDVTIRNFVIQPL